MISAAPAVQALSLPPPYLKIHITVSKHTGKPVFVWQQIEEPAAQDSIVLNGQVADRVEWLLKAYWNKRKHPDGLFGFPDPNVDPREPLVVCHSTAMYAAGLTHSFGLNGHFAEAYLGLEELLTYETPTPPAVAHLLRVKIAPREIHKANPQICPHTVLYLGDIGGREVCFQKHNDGAASIGFLRSAEKKYNTSYRLWVNA